MQVNSIDPVHTSRVDELSGEHPLEVRHVVSYEDPEEFDFLPKKHRIYAAVAAVLVPLALLLGALLRSPTHNDAAHEVAASPRSSAQSALVAKEEAAEQHELDRAAIPPVSDPQPAVAVPSPAAVASAQQDAKQTPAPPSRAATPESAPTRAAPAPTPPLPRARTTNESRARHQVPSTPRRAKAEKAKLYRDLDF